MKLSDSTVNVLKNFSTINPSILFRPGSTITTMSTSKAMAAKANVDETFETAFGIYELSKFIGVLSLFKEPEIECDGKQVKISSGNQTVRYTCTDPKMIIAPPEKEITLPSVEAEFQISADDYNRLVRALNVLQLPEMAIIAQEGKISLAAVNSKEVTADSYRVIVGDCDAEFNAYIKTENLKFIPKEYTVSVSKKGIAKFSTETLTYWVALESNSNFR